MLLSTSSIRGLRHVNKLVLSFTCIVFQAASLYFAAQARSESRLMTQ